MSSRGARALHVAAACALALAALAACAHLCALAWIFARRAGWPLDLEWMEGGTLTHALRVLQGKPIFAPPSVEFIPFLYTPLYPWLLAALARVFGLSYLLGRAVSIAAFACALAIAWRAVRREGGSRAWALCACGAMAAAFPLVDGFYDLVRVDSLHLALIAGGLYLLRHHARSARGVAAAALLLSSAFWAKQTAALFIVAGGVALLAMNARLAPLFAAIVAVACGGGTWLLNRATGGWFWTTIFEIHHHHDLYVRRILFDTQRRMWLAAPWIVSFPVVWLAGAAATRRATPGARYWAWMAVAAVEVSAVSWATQWANFNALMPGYFFLAIFLAVGASELCARLAARPRARAGLSLALGLAACAQLAALRYDPRAHVPTAADRAAAARFLDRLRGLAAAGDVLVPYHPYYPVLAGRPAHFHQMGINDITRARIPVPRDLRAAIAGKRYAAVVLDRPPDERYAAPLHAYQSEPLPARDAPRTFQGWIVRPRLVLTRR